MRLSKYFFLILIVSIAISCKKEKDDPVVEFDKKELLRNYGNQLIVPAYEDFQQSVFTLETSINDFVSISNSSNLSKVRTSFLQAYKKWQACSFTNFGPASTYTLKAICNTYPVDTTRINANINSGTYTLGTASNVAAIGFPALDFLLFPDTSLVVTLTRFGGSTSANRKQYLKDVVSQIKGAINSTVTSWKSGHVSTFINADGNGQGSSLSEMVNALNLDFEKFIRDGKVGIPLGVRSLGTPLPIKTEGYFSKKSLTLFKESISQLQQYFNGKSSSNLGLDDYLNHLNDNNNTSRLSVRINNQFNSIMAKANAISEPISVAVTTNQPKVQELYNELQKMVVLLKVDMSSALSILITYQDNDGD